MAKRRRQTKAGGASRRRTKNREEAAPAAMDPVLPPLPDEVAEDIFLRLPVKSLAVSRSWNGFISSPAFARLHREAATARACVAPWFVVCVPLDTDGGHTWPGQTCVGCPRVFSGAGRACHGVVLVGWLCAGEFSVLNPSTGGELRLPPRRPARHIHSAGLGYDDGEGRHKAVLLEGDGDLWVRCIVFTVSGAGVQWRWRAPRCRRKICDDAIVSANTDPVFADGRLHWMLVSPEKEENGLRAVQNGVLSFEMGSESFRHLPLPPFADENLPRPEYATMAEVDGRLCCLVRDLRRPHTAVALDRRIDLTPHIGGHVLTTPWEGNLFVVCYAGGRQSSGVSRKILLLTTGGASQRAYTCHPDTGELRSVVGTNDYGVQQHLRLVLSQESMLQVDGMLYLDNDFKL